MGVFDYGRFKKGKSCGNWVDVWKYMYSGYGEWNLVGKFYNKKLIEC